MFVPDTIFLFFLNIIILFIIHLKKAQDAPNFSLYCKLDNPAFIVSKVSN